MGTTALSRTTEMASPSRSEGTAPMVPLRLTDAQLDTLHRLIPNPIDQNPWAHWRSPMDMMRQG